MPNARSPIGHFPRVSEYVNLNVSEIVESASNQVQGARAITGTTTRLLPTSLAIPLTKRSPSRSSEVPSPEESSAKRAPNTPQGIPQPV